MSDQSTQLVIISEADLDKNLAESQLAIESIQSLKTAFQPHFSAFSKLAVAAQAIPESAPKAAQAMRRELKKVRLAAEETRREQKAESLLRGKAVDGLNNLLLYALVPIEKHLESIEKKEELAEKARLDTLRQSRSIELSQYTELPDYDLGSISQSQYILILQNAKTAHEAKIAAAKKAEEDRIKREQEEAAERERLRAENERLAKIAVEEKKAREEAERKAAEERKKAEAQAAKERAEREAAEKARLAKEAAERKRLADEAAVKQRAIEEAARKEREAAENKAAEERAAREKAEAELKAAREAEEKRKREEAARIEAEKAAAAAAQEKALAAPDADKLKALAKTIAALPLPTLTSKAGKTFAPKLSEQVNKFAAWVAAEAKKLEG